MTTDNKPPFGWYARPERVLPPSIIYTDKITTGLKVETHYHTLVILWDTSENVCQDLQNGC
jgi:hypothetical protein